MIESVIALAGVLLVANVWIITMLISTKKKNARLVKRVSNLDDAANESYVKFITESRDWAFNYIESVQKSIQEFADTVEPQLNYFNTYGRAVPSHNDIALDVITKAFEGLKAVLPEDNKEK